MQCMKCGREIPAGQAFCEACLADMEKYPVKPGTAVRIPSRREETAPKKQPPRRKTVPAEEKVIILRRRLWVVGVTLTLLLALISGCLFMAVKYIWENDGKPLPGQNYSTVETTAPSENPGSN